MAIGSFFHLLSQMTSFPEPCTCHAWPGALFGCYPKRTNQTLPLYTIAKKPTQQLIGTLFMTSENDRKYMIQVRKKKKIHAQKAYSILIAHASPDGPFSIHFPGGGHHHSNENTDTCEPCVCLCFEYVCPFVLLISRPFVIASFGRQL